MNIASPASRFTVTLAHGPADLLAVQRLRYDVFGCELGADGAGVDHELGLEADPFDAFADHLLLRDLSQDCPNQVIGTYRLLRVDQAADAGGFYSAREFDLSPLVADRNDVLELSRSCIRENYRGGLSLMHLWQALAAYVEKHEIAYLFGVASFAGIDLTAHQNALNLLHDKHLAAPDIRPVVHGEGAVDASHFTTKMVNDRTALVGMPSLIKAYLRMGGVVGAGAYIDRDFQTIDVCMILETAQLTARQRAMLGTP
jgi:putative hemolysin